MTIKCVIFDMAGTTVEDNEDVLKTLYYSLGMTKLHFDFNQIKTLMGRDKRETIGILLESKVEEIHARFEKLMISHYAENAKEVEGTTTYFTKLKSQGIKVALTTGFPRAIADVIINKLDWKNLVDISVCSDEVLCGRPYPHMIKKICRSLGIGSYDCIKVGDTTSDVWEGINSVCRQVYGVTTGNCSRKDFKEFLSKEQIKYTRIIDSLGEITI